MIASNNKPTIFFGAKMLSLILGFLLVMTGVCFIFLKSIPFNKMISTGLFLLSLMIIVNSMVITVPAGQVKVATLFGKTQDQTYYEGLHVVNPLLDFTLFDLRQKTHKERAGIPSEDKLITTMDVSVQYRTIGEMTPDILRNTGTTEALIQVHLIPKLRSILREQGKGVAMSQDFFKESIQKQLQETLQLGLSEFLAPKGVQVETVLIRDVILPNVIQTSITETKKREQEVLKQQAELLRFATEQDQKVKQAESEFKAAKLEAQKIKELADAEAYRIKTEYLGRAEGIAKLKAQLTPEYIKYLHAQQWDGKLPVYSGGENIPMIDLK